jgi:hypothetical protein
MAHASARRSIRAWRLETEPSFRTTSHAGSRPTRAGSFEISMGVPVSGMRRSVDTRVLLVLEKKRILARSV